MKKLALLTATLIGSTLASAVAQVPFDMSPESDRVQEAPSQVLRPLNPAQTIPLAPALDTAFSRHILPTGNLNLAGEEARRSVVVYLTAAQAAAPASLDFSYLNAVVIAPESSSLKLRVNDVEVSNTPIAASSQAGALSFAMPEGVLRPGANTIEFIASQRHRTDCTIQSTYELWTNIASATARLRFEGDNLGSIRQLADLGAVGVDENGDTTVRLIVGNLSDSRARSALMRLSQQLAIALRAPSIKIETASELSPQAREGVLDVVFNLASALPPEIAAALPQAQSSSLATMLELPSGANTLVVTGPDWSAITRAGEAIHTAAPGAPTRMRTDIARPHPMLIGGSEIALSELGVDTVEFNGRFFTSSFQFELPADFYAYRYGTLDLVLDAAFSSDVLPESEIDIYTNGQIASATPLLRTDSGILRNTVMRIPMTNLRPGRNIVDMSVSLQTTTDAVCAVGTTGQLPTRFVLSNSTRLRMPEYARAANLPDLTVLTGIGWPYSEQASVPLIMTEDTQDVTAAMVLLSRIASASDKVLPIDAVSAGAVQPDQNAIIVMPLNDMPVSISGRTGISGLAAPSAVPSALDQFSTEQGASPSWRRPAEWLSQRLGLDLQDLRIAAFSDDPRAISANSAALSQVRQPEGGIWTILTAGDSAVLLEGTNRMAVTENWRAISGRITEVSRNTDKVDVVEASTTTLVQTQPFSFANMRLVAANWFSGNILYFAAAIMALGVLLMLATSFVLTAVGRRE